MAISFAARQPEYAALWASCTIRPERAAEARKMAKRILANRDRYNTVSNATGVPWHVIGIIHAMEASLDFDMHLHNGDPLRRDGVPVATVQVPRGRGPFASWEESAIDALRYDGLDKFPDWSIERVAFALETTNGFGYLRHGIHSPYLWSYTTAYERGKYVADGSWSAIAVSQQCGGMALLKAMLDLDPSQIAMATAAPVNDGWVRAPAPEAPSPVVSGAQSKTVWSLLMAGGATVASSVQTSVSWLAERVEAIVGLMDSVHKDVEGGLAPMKALAGLVKANITTILPAIAIGLIIVAIVRHVGDRNELKRAKSMLPKGDAQ